MTRKTGKELIRRNVKRLTDPQKRKNRAGAPCFDHLPVPNAESVKDHVFLAELALLSKRPDPVPKCPEESCIVNWQVALCTHTSALAHTCKNTTSKTACSVLRSRLKGSLAVKFRTAKILSVLALSAVGSLQASTVVVTAFNQLPNGFFYDWPNGPNRIDPVAVGPVVVSSSLNPTTLNHVFGGLLARELGPSVPGNGGGFGSEPILGTVAPPLILNFDQPVAAFGATFVHYSFFGQTFFTTYPATVEVFTGLDATGTLLGTATDGGGGFTQPTADFRALWSSQRDIRSARISATSPDGGYFVDGFGLSLSTQVPEPSTAGLALLALVGLALRRRRGSCV